MAKAGGEPRDMSPLAARLEALRQSGVSYNDMQNRATAAGHPYTSSSFEQVAKDQRSKRLPKEALEAVAVVLGISVREAADLDDERFEIQRDYLTRRPSAQDEDEVIANVSMDKLLAEIARRAGEGNPHR